MNLKLVIPRDPLIFRDGKPFTAVPGERSKSLIFPYPATLAGAVRTRDGTNSGKSEFAKNRIEKLKELKIRGPVLVELETNGNIKEWYFPAPADAVFIQKENNVNLYSLSPLNTGDRLSNIEDGLALVGASENIKDKPMSKPPLYWTWKMLQTWLENSADIQDVKPAEYGITGLERETRTHVGIEASTQSALSGALFQTSGMEFVLAQEKLSHSRQLALALQTDAKFESGVDFLGGERRVIRWEDVADKFPSYSDKDMDKIIGKIKADKHCRLILATPASFEQGYIPAKYKEQVKAVALPRYQTISGWDYDLSKPKPTRRLVPAGAVYFLDLEKVDINTFIKDVWLQPISDDVQSCNDGFGLALLGTWDGKFKKMEVKHE